MIEKLNAVAEVVGSLGKGGAVAEQARATGRFTVQCHEAIPGHEAEYEAALADVNAFDGTALHAAPDEPEGAQLAALRAQEVYRALMARLEQARQLKWQESFDNVVCTLGKNYLLDNGLAGSAFTAAFFLGLISSVSYTAVSAADTMASHAGWLEAGATNAPTFSGARKTAAWSAASAGSKALSAGLVFTFTGTGTVKGAFLTTVSTVDGTTGTLYSAGLFTGGDQPVVSTNTLTVSYTASL